MKIDVMKSRSAMILLASIASTAKIDKAVSINPSTELVPFENELISPSAQGTTSEVPDISSSYKAPASYDSVKILQTPQLEIFKSISLDVFNILSQQRSFAILRKFLNNEDVVDGLKNVVNIIFTYQNELSEAFSSISYEVSIGKIYFAFQQDILGFPDGKLGFENIQDLFQPYKAKYPIVSRLISSIKDLASAVQQVEFLPSDYDDKEAQVLFKLFMIKAHERGEKIPILNPLVEATLSDSQRESFQKQYISSIEKSLAITVEQYRIISNIYAYFENLAANLLVTLNGIAESAIKKDEDSLDAFVTLMVDELKMLYVHNID